MVFGNWKCCKGCPLVNQGQIVLGGLGQEDLLRREATGVVVWRTRVTKYCRCRLELDDVRNWNRNRQQDLALHGMLIIPSSESTNTPLNIK